MEDEDKYVKVTVKMEHPDCDSVEETIYIKDDPYDRNDPSGYILTEFGKFQESEKGTLTLYYVSYLKENN